MVDGRWIYKKIEVCFNFSNFFVLFLFCIASMMPLWRDDSTTLTTSRREVTPTQGGSILTNKWRHTVLPCKSTLEGLGNRRLRARERGVRVWQIGKFFFIEQCLSWWSMQNALRSHTFKEFLINLLCFHKWYLPLKRLSQGVVHKWCHSLRGRGFREFVTTVAGGGVKSDQNLRDVIYVWPSSKNPLSFGITSITVHT